MKKVQTLIENLKDREGSYNKAAKKIGLTGGAINHLMHGETIAKDETVIKLCNEFNINPESALLETAKDRSKGNAKKIWANIEKKLASVAASIFALSTLPTLINSIDCILC